MTTCKECKHPMIENKGTFTHIYFREITLHNVPYFACTHCDREFYKSDKKVTYFLSEAYRRNLSEINYKE